MRLLKVLAIKGHFVTIIFILSDIFATSPPEGCRLGICNRNSNVSKGTPSNPHCWPNGWQLRGVSTAFVSE
jgi:hypothetical protein